MATVRNTFHETTGDTLDILTNLEPHFPLSIFLYSKRRASETVLKINTPSPRDHISFPNMIECRRVLFHLRGNKNQLLYHPWLYLNEQIYVFVRLLE